MFHQLLSMMQSVRQNCWKTSVTKRNRELKRTKIMTSTMNAFLQMKGKQWIFWINLKAFLSNHIGLPWKNEKHLHGFYNDVSIEKYGVLIISISVKATSHYLTKRLRLIWFNYFFCSKILFETCQYCLMCQFRSASSWKIPLRRKQLNHGDMLVINSCGTKIQTFFYTNN